MNGRPTDILTNIQTYRQTADKKSKKQTDRKTNGLTNGCIDIKAGKVRTKEKKTEKHKKEG